MEFLSILAGNSDLCTPAWVAARSQENQQGPAHGCGPATPRLGWAYSAGVAFSASLEAQTLEPPKPEPLQAVRRAGGGMGGRSKLLEPWGYCSTWGSPAVGPIGPHSIAPTHTPVLPPSRPRITNIPLQPTPAAAAWEGGTTADSRRPPETLNPFAPSRWSPRPGEGSHGCQRSSQTLVTRSGD